MNRKKAASKEVYAHGAIVRMRLENFVTYDSLEFSPGPNLNVIIGPNGTGKSTIVCAICLGMTGKPAVLGRASAIADFIKYGKNQALIEVELNNTAGNNHVVKRMLYKDNRSEWFINERSVKLKEVEDLVSSLNIQVTNLCQFLPQEKVTEFARMNPQELLENTEKAVGGTELYEQHNRLKDQSKVSKDLERELNIVEESLKKEEAINSRLESKVSSFIEKRKYEESIQWLKRKRACVFYKEKREEYEKVKKDKDKYTKELDELNQQLIPLQAKNDELEKRFSKQNALLASKSHLIQESMRSSRDLSNKLDDMISKTAEMKTEYENKVKEIKNHKQKIKELRASVDLMKSEYEEAKLGLQSIEESEATLKKKDHEVKQENDKLSIKEYEYKQEIAKHKAEMELIKKKVTDMKNVKEEKLNKLRQQRATKDIYNAIVWLEQNRNKFTGIVYEPMFLLINVKDKNASKYVENLIPFRDLACMFLFERSDDMHKFLTEVRDNMRLVVNTALLPKNSLDQFNPPRPIQDIKAFGFRSYVREMIDAPDQILVYLCLYAKIHQVPIGSEQTQQNLAAILPQMSEYGKIYTSTHLYSFSRSRYTNKVSSTSSEVGDGFWLTSSVDQGSLNQLEERANLMRNEVRTLESKLAEILEARHALERQLEAHRADFMKLKEKRLYIENIGKKLTVKLTLLRTLESQEVDVARESRLQLERVAELARAKARLFFDYLEVAKRLSALNRDRILAVYKDAQHQREKLALEGELRTYTQRKQELEVFSERYMSVLKAAKDEAKVALDAASKINECNLEKGLPDKHKQRFAKLPDTLEKIESEIHQCEAIAQCSSDVDERIIEDFTNRQKLIEQLRQKFERQSELLRTHQSDYESVKNEWLERVEEMIQAINRKFSALFVQLKCAGEVALARPDNGDEFARYGVCIKVSFRTDEQLQELTAWQQSGGEKSVSTMMFMIALQEMTRCPFRVVDEINQGMDPVNERKVFDIIVQNSCARQLAQYFLLTPKLLPDLSFDDKTKVICVYNGPYNLAHFKYNLRNIIDIRKKINVQ